MQPEMHEQACSIWFWRVVSFHDNHDLFIDSERALAEVSCTFSPVSLPITLAITRVTYPSCSEFGVHSSEYQSCCSCPLHFSAMPKRKQGVEQFLDLEASGPRETASRSVSNNFRFDRIGNANNLRSAPTTSEVTLSERLARAARTKQQRIAREAAARRSQEEYEAQIALDAAQDEDFTGEFSVTIVQGGRNIDVEKWFPLVEKFLYTKTEAGIVAVEKGSRLEHLHFQCLMKGHFKSAATLNYALKSFLGWNNAATKAKNGNIRCVTLKQVGESAWFPMIGYCWKDCDHNYFRVAMHNISDEDVVQGKLENAKYGAGPMKHKCELTNRNVYSRAKTFRDSFMRDRPQDFVGTLTQMMRTGMFVPSASFVVPYTGKGIDEERGEHLWKIINEPEDATEDDIRDIFMSKPTKPFMSSDPIRRVSRSQPQNPERDFASFSEICGEQLEDVQRIRRAKALSSCPAQSI